MEARWSWRDSNPRPENNQIKELRPFPAFRLTSPRWRASFETGCPVLIRRSFLRGQRSLPAVSGLFPQSLLLLLPGCSELAP